MIYYTYSAPSDTNSTRIKWIHRRAGRGVRTHGNKYGSLRDPGYGLVCIMYIDKRIFLFQSQCNDVIVSDNVFGSTPHDTQQCGWARRDMKWEQTVHTQNKKTGTPKPLQ